MKRNMIKIKCVLCSKTIAETHDRVTSIASLAEKRNIAEISLSKKDYEEEGYICDSCFSLLSSSSKKIVRIVKRLGNGCHVVLPKKMMNKKIVVFEETIPA